MARTTIATDAFASMGNFTQVNPSWGNVTAAAGVITGSYSGFDSGGEVQAAVWSGAGSFSNDQGGSVVIGALSFLSLANGVGVIARSSTDTNGSRDYYQLYVASDSAGPTYTTILSKVVNGVRSQLHSAVVAWSNGDRVEIEVLGTTVTGCKNGTALGGSFTQTDSSLSTGKPGVCASGSVITGDDFQGFNVTGLTDATASATGASGASSAGTVVVAVRPPPPYTLTTVTG